MKRIAVLISNIGTGTNLQGIINGVERGKINAEIVLVLSDTKESQGLQRAQKHSLTVEICPQKEDLLKILQKYNLDFICLAGWKQIILDEVIETFPHRIINTHPGLIPNTLQGTVKNPDGTKALWNRGKMTGKAIQNFLDSKSTYAGCTNHFLSDKFDFGKVNGRCFEKIRPRDTVDSLYTRLKKKENALYVRVLAKLCKRMKNTKTVLVVDGGGRGSALVDKYTQSSHVAKVLAAPGNDLMTVSNKTPVKIFPQVKTTDIPFIINICKKEKVDLIDVAQDDAVEAGLVDSLLKEGFKVFGPTRAAGQIEWDKAWSRKFMKKYDIPTPRFKICSSQTEGFNFIKSQKEGKWFIKASGLAAGKGALHAPSNNKAIEKISEMKNFGKAGKTFLIEECLCGEEFSSFAIVGKTEFQIVGHAQDHKTVFDANQGPNTGGMGCSSPPLVITPKILVQIKSIFAKTIKGLVKEKRPYLGILYLGGIIDQKGKVWVIEFNARWGDPEAQVIVPSIKNDFYELALAVLEGRLNKIKIDKDNFYRIVVAATSRGYPSDYKSVVGKQIFGLKQLIDSGTKIFGAGVKITKGKYMAAGGRLFYVIGEGASVAQARKIAYNTIFQVCIEGNNLHFRTDIGYRDLERVIKS